MKLSRRERRAEARKNKTAFQPEYGKGTLGVITKEMHQLLNAKPEPEKKETPETAETNTETAVEEATE